MVKKVIIISEWGHCCIVSLGVKGNSGDPGSPGIHGTPGDPGIRGPRGLIGKRIKIQFISHGYIIFIITWEHKYLRVLLCSVSN